MIRGVDLAWELVSIRVKIEVLADRSALRAEEIQKNIDRLADPRYTALDVFVSQAKWRKDLTFLK